MFTIPEENGNQLLFNQKEVDKIANGYLEETTKKLRETIAERDSVIEKQNIEIHKLAEEKVKMLKEIEELKLELQKEKENKITITEEKLGYF